MSDQELADEESEYSGGNGGELPVSRRSVLKGASALGVSSAVLSEVPRTVEAHDVPNHMVETPPMGWNSWNTFACDINAELIKDTADAMVESGMKDAGYEYVNIDDCWQTHERDADGNLQPDPEKFPNGIDAVADYVHERGLKLGIYESAGSETCAGYPGSLRYEKQDAQKFAEWGVDYLKYDNCGDHYGFDPQTRYKRMWNALDATGRDIVKSQCSWGSYDEWTWASDLGANLWRTTGDIYDDWGRIMDILDQQVGLAEYAKPGHWNDPDMLEVGNAGLSDSESRAHFSLWCLLAAPLIAGNDIRNMDQTTTEILTNEEVIAVNQDPAGIQGTKRRDDGTEEVWAKPLENGDVAIVLLNRGESAATVTTTANEVGLDSGHVNHGHGTKHRHHSHNNGPGYVVRDLWEKREVFTTGDIAATVPGHDVAMFRVRSGTPNEAPPLTTIISEDDGFVGADETRDVTVTFANDGRTAVQDVMLELHTPDDWTVESGSQTQFGAVAPGKAVETTWSVTLPTDTESDTYDLGAQATYRWHGETLSRRSEVSVTVPPAPPTSDTYLSDMEWLEASNGWGPVERDMSVGEQDAGDGNTITIDGMSYEKGLGVNAPSTISYYLGGNCSTFVADIGVDDEVRDDGSVTFEVWADGENVYESDVLTGSDGPESVTADISGADRLKLVVTNGGDNKNYDHADWAAAHVLV